MLVLLALTASEALVAGPGALHSHSRVSLAARSSPAVAQFGLFNKGDDSAPTKAKKGKQVKKAVKKSFFQKAEPEPEPEDSPLEFLKSLGGLGFLLSVPGAAATVVAIIIFGGGGKLPDSTPFEFLNGFYPPAVQTKAVNKEKNIALEKQAKIDKVAAEKKAAMLKANLEAADAPKPKPAAKPAAKKDAKKADAAPAAAAKPKAAKPKPGQFRKVGRTDYAKNYEKLAKTNENRVGKPTPKQGQLLKVVDPAMAGKPGFNKQGQPSSTGAKKALEKEQARAAAKAAFKASDEAKVAAAVELQQAKQAALKAKQAAAGPSGEEIRKAKQAEFDASLKAAKERGLAQKAERAAAAKVTLDAGTVRQPSPIMTGSLLGPRAGTPASAAAPAAKAAAKAAPAAAPAAEAAPAN